MDLPDWNPLAVALLGLLAALTSLAVRIAALGIIPANRKPSTGMAWLLAVLLNPLLGLVAFAFFGRTQLGKVRHQRQREATARIATATQDIPPLQGEGDLPPYVASVARLNRRLGALPMLPDNDVEVIEDYRGSILAMTEAVARRQNYVNVEFYITAWDEMTGAAVRGPGRRH